NVRARILARRVRGIITPPSQEEKLGANPGECVTPAAGIYRLAGSGTRKKWKKKSHIATTPRVLSAAGRTRWRARSIRRHLHRDRRAPDRRRLRARCAEAKVRVIPAAERSPSRRRRAVPRDRGAIHGS